MVYITQERLHLNIGLNIFENFFLSKQIFMFFAVYPDKLQLLESIMTNPSI